MRAWSAAAVLSCTLLLPAVAHAGPDRDACVAASEDGQTLKIKGQLTAAREKLMVCTDEACPRMVKQDCAHWIEEIERAMPTIVLGARDAQGHDLIDVAVSLDGTRLVTRLEGKALSVDPGPHTLRFEAAGLPPREERVVVRQGEKNRPLTLTLGEASRLQVSPFAARPEPATAHRSALPWVLGGIGLVALAAGVGVGVGSILYANGLRSGCGQTATLCSQSDVDLGWAMYVFAGVNDAIGGVLTLTSAVLFLTRKPVKPTSAAVVIAPTAGGAAILGVF